MRGLPELLGLTPAQTGTALQIIAAAGFFLLQDALLHLPPVRRALVAACTRSGEDLSEKEARRVFQQASSRLIGEVFNLIALPLALLVLTDPDMWADRLHSSSPTSQVLLLTCSGYFIHDAYVCVSQIAHEGLMYSVHALTCMSIYTYGAFTGWQHLYGAVFILYEASTPFVHMHWYLLRMGRSGTSLFVANGLCMLLVFFCVRIIFGNVMTYDYWLVTDAVLANPSAVALQPAIIWVYRLANLTLTGLNLFWVRSMLKGALKAVRKAASKKAKDA